MTTWTGKRRTLGGYVSLGAKGFCMGAADVIPGVSGGTMAFILGIYPELIASIRSFDLGFFKRLFTLRVRTAFRGTSWPFLAAVGTGILAAVLSLARLLSWLLHHQPILIWSFFFGLIAASVFAVARYQRPWTPYLLFWACLGAVGTYGLVGLVPAETPHSPAFLFASGAAAICAMILPGVSGAFILVLLGKYHYVLDAVNRMDAGALLMVGAGAAVGLLCFVRLLNWLLNRFTGIIIAVLTGMLLGSLRKIWPWKAAADAGTHVRETALPAYQMNVLPARWDGEVLLALVLACLGIAVVLLMNALSGREAPLSGKAAP